MSLLTPLPSPFPPPSCSLSAPIQGDHEKASLAEKKVGKRNGPEIRFRDMEQKLHLSKENSIVSAGKQRGREGFHP